MAFSIFLTNLGKYNEGYLVGEWVKLPITKEELDKVFERIGINETYEEFFISDYDWDEGDCTGFGEYENLNELNYLASLIDEIPSYDQDKFYCVLSAGIWSYGDAVRSCIETVLNLDCFNYYPDINSDYDLGYYWVNEAGVYDLDKMGNLANYIDYESLGRDIRFESEGGFGNSGWVEKIDELSETYGGANDIPEEYKLV